MIEALRRAVAIARATLAQEKTRPTLPPRKAEELAFLPAALEVLETPPSPIGRAIAWAIMLLFTTAVAWAAIGELDIHATAQGQIIPRGKTKTVQPPETGPVIAIHVADGDHVTAGDVLLELDPTNAAADLTRLSREREEVLVAIARLNAQLAGDGTLAPVAGVSPAVLRTHALQLAARLAEHRALLDGLDREREEMRARRDELRAEQTGLEQRLPLAREVLAMRSQLAASRSGSKLDLLEARDAMIGQAQSLAAIGHQISQTEAGLRAAEQHRRQAEEQFRADALRDLADAESRAEMLGAEIDKARQRLALLRVRAPVDGVVQQLVVAAPGAIITQGQAVLALVPLNEGIDVEAKLPNKDIGFVTEGQAAELKVNAFPFTRYGTIAGQVVTVSRDALMTDEDDPASGPLYAVRVRPDRDTIATEAGPVRLSPGMAVTVEIKTGRRRVIEYLMAPLLRYRDEAWRER